MREVLANPQTVAEHAEDQTYQNQSNRWSIPVQKRSVVQTTHTRITSSQDQVCQNQPAPPPDGQKQKSIGCPQSCH